MNKRREKREMKKKILASILSMMLAVQPAILCGAEEFEAGETVNVQEEAPEYVQQDSEDTEEIKDENEESVDEVEDVPENNASSEELQDAAEDDSESEEVFTDQSDTDGLDVYDSGETQAYTVTGTITAQLSQGVMTVTGSGEMPDYSSGMEQPWRSADIKKLVISDGITRIGKCNFCLFNIEEISFPETLTSIGEAAFENCYSLKSINLPDSLVTVGEAAFYKCWDVTDIHLGKNVKNIENLAFAFANTKQVTLPASLESIAPLAFNYTSLETYILEPGNTHYKVIDGVLFSADGRKLIRVPENKNTDTYQIPDGVQEIGESSFLGNNKIKQVLIPSSVTAIGAWVFQESSLESLVIPDTVTQIGYGIATESKSLKTVYIGNGIAEIPYKAFEQCTSLESVTLGSSIKLIDSRVFLNCTRLTTINLPEGLETIEGSSFYGCAALKYLNIPSTVKKIENSAFDNCADDLVVNIPSSLVKVGDGSYRRISNLSVTGTYKYDRAYELLNYTNQERAKVGAAPLSMDEELMKAAMTRAVECSVKFDHTRPTGESWISLCNGKAYAENILYAPRSLSAEGDMTVWMNSAGHKMNILNTEYTSVGIGCFEQNGGYYCVQLFGKSTPGSFTPSGNYTTKLNMSVIAEDYTIKKLVWCDQELTLYTQTVSKGDKQQMAVVIAESGESRHMTLLDPEDFQWSSSNPSVATVDAQGNVKGISVGHAEIIATTSMLDGFTVTAPVRIKDGEVNFWDTIDGDGEDPFGNHDRNNESGNGNNGNNNQEDDDGNSSNSGIKLNKASVTLYKGKSTVLKASGTKGRIIWKSSNSRVAAVNQSGKITAKKKGTAVITASLSNGKKAVCKVTVKEIPAKRIKLNVKELRAYKGYKFIVKTALTPKNSTDTITWKSSNSKVVSVTSKGVIRMKKNGKATITARTASGKKATVKVTVWNKRKVYKK